MKALNKINYIAITAFILVAGFSACKRDYLDLSPKGKLIAQSTSDYNLLFNNTALINTGAGVTEFPNGQLIMGDEVLSSEPYFSSAALRTQRFFRYDKDTYNPEDDNAEMKGIMTQLYTYNKIANEVMESTGGTDDQKKALYAEAVANRAWCYFMLVNFYGKPYNSLTATSDLAFPIITVADVAETKFTRATVQAVYDFMIKDLTDAIPSLPKNTSIRARLGKAAAEGLLGKVLVFMGRYTDALPYLNNAIDDLPTNYTVALYNLNVTMANAGTTGAWGYNPTTNPSSFQSLYPTAWLNTENIFCKQVNAGAFTADRSDILLTPEAAALFRPSDMRVRFFSTKASGGAALPVTGALRRNSGTVVQIGIRLADVQLLRAECLARTGKIADAITILEAFRTTRMPAADAKVSINDQSALIRFIIDERTREFAINGFRWFDMRRLSTDPLFSSTIYKHKYYDANGKLTEYTLTPDRFTLRFTQKVIDANPGMPNNP
ncbi:RagB/SusD family nutrient uptake outer membrane protein [Pedobacter rhizosphaerae]|uniref:SusD family protein n=1 Tax=Pedobacter rhizosphaerae TaxID=390241 RepID=A0A1H9R2K8_9SPHI|nr:RagB/SusD family nutrient uptake outer membrane protein [Pedobacter rhizosphaerae]SER66964.1 SusD family protein [Pedobacter rhizosphaerae]